MLSKKLNSRTNSYLSVLTFLVVLAVVGIISQRFLHGRLDFTRDKQYTLSKAAVKTLQNLPDLITIKVVMSKDLPTQFVQVRTYVMDLLNEFEARSGGKLNLVFEDPGENEQKKQQATSLGIQEVQLQEQSQGGMQIKKGFFGLAMTYGDKKEVIPVLQNLETFEYDLVVKLKKLIGATKTIGMIEGAMGSKLTFTLPGNPPKITTGFDENFPGLKEQIDKLYKVEKLDPSASPIAENIDLLFVCAPSRLSELEKFRIDQHLMKGKPIIFLTPGLDVNLSQGISGTASNNGYEDLMTHYGLGVKKNVILEPRQWQMVRFGNSFFPTPYPYWIVESYTSMNTQSAITSKLQSISFPWTSSVDLDSSATVKNDSSIQILVSTTPSAWEETGNFSLLPRDLKEYLPLKPRAFPLVVLKTAKFKSFYASHPLPTTDSANKIDSIQVLREAKSESRILVVSNALFATDFYVGYTNAAGNIHLLLNALDQLALDADLINIRSREIDNSPIDEAKKISAKLPTVLVNMILAPVLLLIVGIFIGMRRRKKESMA